MSGEAKDYNSPDFVFAPTVPDQIGANMPARVGLPAPDFVAPSLGGDTVRLADLLKKSHVVFMTGAVTSPMFAFEVPAMNLLSREYEGRGFSFFLLYSRESHPAEHYPHHSSMEQKIAHAREFQRLERVEIPPV